jgi:hypothetical protein
LITGKKTFDAKARRRKENYLLKSVGLKANPHYFDYVWVGLQADAFLSSLRTTKGAPDNNLSQ